MRRRTVCLRRKHHSVSGGKQGQIVQDLVPCVQASGSSSEAGAPLKEFTCREGGFAISPNVLGHDLLSSQSGLNYQGGGPSLDECDWPHTMS